MAQCIHQKSLKFTFEVWIQTLTCSRCIYLVLVIFKSILSPIVGALYICPFSSSCCIFSVAYMPADNKFVVVQARYSHLLFVLVCFSTLIPKELPIPLSLLQSKERRKGDFLGPLPISPAPRLWWPLRAPAMEEVGIQWIDVWVHLYSYYLGFRI